MAAFGGGGAAVLPFAVGAIAQAHGVKVLLPFVLALSGGLVLLWQGIPRIPRGEREYGNENGLFESQSQKTPQMRNIPGDNAP